MHAFTTLFAVATISFISFAHAEWTFNVGIQRFEDRDCATYPIGIEDDEYQHAEENNCKTWDGESFAGFRYIWDAHTASEGDEELEAYGQCEIGAWAESDCTGEYLGQVGDVCIEKPNKVDDTDIWQANNPGYWDREDTRQAIGYVREKTVAFYVLVCYPYSPQVFVVRTQLEHIAPASPGMNFRRRFESGRHHSRNGSRSSLRCLIDFDPSPKLLCSLSTILLSNAPPPQFARSRTLKMTDFTPIGTPSGSASKRLAEFCSPRRVEIAAILDSFLSAFWLFMTVGIVGSAIFFVGRPKSKDPWLLGLQVFGFFVDVAVFEYTLYCGPDVTMAQVTGYIVKLVAKLSAGPIIAVMRILKEQWDDWQESKKKDA
ncbi:hypothetical protein LTR37_011562 [Vermiconidia calcicola]|uniref:Uncharacterized protein n=1 Tax=Vermiconidia calcicola TaxID=1690605 RepID=A0ACC3N1U6_9PEZI|nr:hypothetical protein LTR37_011562 [Vermiconidia calcicola]